ncbi:MAG: DUF2846 domain-containing protein [Bradyrhizobium sp.]
MSGRAMALVMAAILLSGCMTHGAGSEYAAVVQKIGPPKPGQSRVVVLQENRQGLSMSHCACDMKLDGQPMGKVIYGSYAYADRPAGRHQLVASELMFPGETARDFSTESGRTYYFLIRSSERHDAVNAGALIGGIAGVVATSIVTSGSKNTGPADLFPLDEAAARTTLANLQLAQ